MDESDDGLIRPNETVQRYLASAKEARTHLGKTWEYHIDNGRALWEFKLQLEREIPPPSNPAQRLEDQQRYRDSMSEFLRTSGLHEDAEDAIWTKPERSNLMKIMERLPEVEEFREWYGEKHGKDKLRRLNNPSHVWTKFQIWKGEKKQKEKPTKQDETVRLVKILDTCCDALHVARSGEYTELLDRVKKFDGTNFPGIPTEVQQIEAGKWVAENQRLTHDLETAQTGLTRTLDEVTRLKDNREKQAATLTRAFELLKASTAPGALFAAKKEARAFVKEMFPDNPWSDDWNQREKVRVEKVLDGAVERAAMISPEPESSLEELAAAVLSPTVPRSGAEVANDIEIPEVYLLPESDEAKIYRALWITKEGNTYCVYVRHRGECHRKPAVSGSIALSMAQALRVTAVRDRKVAFDAMTGTEMIEVTGSGKWHPARPSTPTATDEVGAEEESEFEEVVEEVEPNRQQTEEDLVRDWLRRDTRRDAETPTLIHNWLGMKHGRDVPVARIEELVRTIAPPAQSSDAKSADALVQQVEDFVREFLRRHPRLDRADDDNMAKVIRQKLEEKAIARIGITNLKKMIADIAPLPRGRKAKVQ